MIPDQSRSSQSRLEQWFKIIPALANPDTVNPGYTNDSRPGQARPLQVSPVRIQFWVVEVMVMLTRAVTVIIVCMRYFSSFTSARLSALADFHAFPYPYGNSQDDNRPRFDSC